MHLKQVQERKYSNWNTWNYSPETQYEERKSAHYIQPSSTLKIKSPCFGKSRENKLTEFVGGFFKTEWHIVCKSWHIFFPSGWEASRQWTVKESVCCCTLASSTSCSPTGNTIVISDFLFTCGLFHVLPWVAVENWISLRACQFHVQAMHLYGWILRLLLMNFVSG